MKQDLSVLRVSLLAENHLFILDIIFCEISIICLILSPVIKILVSSANILISPNLQQFTKSLIYIKNKRGPKTDPYDTPHVIDFSSD